MLKQLYLINLIEKDWPLFEELFGSSFQKQVSVHTRIPNTHHCLDILLNRPFKKGQLIMKRINSQINQAIKLRCLKIVQTLLSNQDKRKIAAYQILISKRLLKRILLLKIARYHHYVLYSCIIGGIILDTSIDNVYLLVLTAVNYI